MSMDANQYEAGQTQAMLLGPIIADLPVAEMLRAIERADTVGAILDPTAYRGGHERMRAFGDYLRALGQAQAKWRALASTVERTEGVASMTRDLLATLRAR